MRSAMSGFVKRNAHASWSDGSLKDFSGQHLTCEPAHGIDRGR